MGMITHLWQILSLPQPWLSTFQIQKVFLIVVPYNLEPLYERIIFVAQLEI